MTQISFPELLSRVNQHAIKGFLADDECAALFSLAQDACHLGPCLEIGSYCGKSTIFLGSACKQSNSGRNKTLYAVDHHRGSEEHQLGEEYHDGDLYDAAEAHMNSFPAFRRAMDMFALTEHVVPIVASSAVAVRDWATPLGMVFVDGGHSSAMSEADCVNWCQHIAPGGILAIHDIFEDPAAGGQGPFWALQAVLKNYPFEYLAKKNSLGVLRRVA